MLPALVLLLGLAQPPEPRLFLWTIEEGEPQSTILVTITPTPFGLVSGFEVKTITLDLVPTRADPKPRAIRPLKTEPAPRWGLQATFTTPTRRFHLKVTLADGSVHDLDVYRTAPPDERKEFGGGRLQLISFHGSVDPGERDCAGVVIHDGHPYSMPPEAIGLPGVVYPS